MVQELRFDIIFGDKDVGEVVKALMKQFKSGKDEPIKTVGLALTVAELEVCIYRDLMSEYCTNLDEVIEGVRLQARERASYLYKH